MIDVALGDYEKTTYVNGQAPGLSANNLNKNEDKTEELDTAVKTHNELIDAHLADDATDAHTPKNIGIADIVAGDLVYGSGADALTRLAKGTARYQLAMNANATTPEWVASLQSLLTAAGDIVYASAANTPARLERGTDGQVLILSNGVPAWGSGSSVDKITSVNVDTDSAQVSITDLSLGEYSYVVLLGQVKTDQTAQIRFRFNNQTGNVYYNASSTLEGFISSSVNFYNYYYGSIRLDIYNKASNKKPLISEGNSSGQVVTGRRNHSFELTTDITSIQILPSAGKIAAGSVFTLLGVK